MRVKVNGIGPIDFPDSMSQQEVRDVLRQFEPQKDNSLQKILEAMQKLLDKKAQVIREPQVVQVEKQVIVKVPEIKEVQTQKIIERETKPKAWLFQIERDENDMIVNVRAYPDG